MMDQKPAGTVGYVDARIRGRKIRFCLPREPNTFRMLEQSRGPISGLVQRILGGRYDSMDVRVVLAVAHPFVPIESRSAESRMAMAMRLLRDEPEPEQPTNGAPLERIDALLAHVPFEGWVTLAMLIIAAAVNGLRAEKALLDFDQPDVEAGQGTAA